MPRDESLSSGLARNLNESPVWQSGLARLIFLSSHKNSFPVMYNVYMRFFPAMYNVYMRFFPVMYNVNMRFFPAMYITV